MSGLSPVGPGAAAGPTLGLTPQMQAAAQNNLFGGIGALGSGQTSNIPAYTGLVNNIQNNPFAASYQSGANQAGGMMQAGGQNAFNTGGALQGAGGQVLNTAFDPQSALYNRYLQQMEQQFQATNAQSGIASSPYAAGLNAQNLQNFNISWQAQQLANQIAGLNAAGGAFSTGANLQQGGAGEVAAGAALPFSTYNAIQQAPLAALSGLQQYGIASQTPQIQQNTGYAQLLGLQPALAGAQNQTAQTQAALQQQMLNQIGGGVGAIAGLGLAPFTGGASLGLMSGLGGIGSFGGGGGGYGGVPNTMSSFGSDSIQDYLQDLGD